MNASMIYRICVLVLLFLSGCGYRIEEGKDAEDPIAIRVPYVEGDVDGLMTQAITRELATSGYFRPDGQDAHFTLKVAIRSLGNDGIGYRYDRKEKSGGLQHNLVGAENRRTVHVDVTLIDERTEEVILGPTSVSADEDYDFVGVHSLRGLTFINAQGERQTSLSFSLGQLDSIEGAQDDALSPLFKRLAQKIVDGLVDGCK